MRALRLVGLENDGQSVILEDPDSQERFTLPIDERLRAASRGDLARLGQLEIEAEYRMRPREIQARIRAGETVDQVVEYSGMPRHRVERFAYPVLLERSDIADQAKRAHPLREDGPDVQILSEAVAHAFAQRGHDVTQVRWDAWRPEDGNWIVQLSWSTGRSDNAAHWVFQRGIHGGTVRAIDDLAAELTDPYHQRTLRTVRPVTALAQQALELGQHKPQNIDGPEILVREESPILPEQANATEERREKRRGHPIVPAWENGLSSARSQRG